MLHFPAKIVKYYNFFSGALTEVTKNIRRFFPLEILLLEEKTFTPLTSLMNTERFWNECRERRSKIQNFSRLAYRGERHWKIRPPPPIFVDFWPPPSQFISAAATVANFVYTHTSCCLLYLPERVTTKPPTTKENWRWDWWALLAEREYLPL